MFDAGVRAPEHQVDDPDRPAFRHEALFYSGHGDYVASTTRFIREGLQAGEPVMVVVSKEKADLIRSELGADAASVIFADMVEVGRNPARIIPAWRDFVAEHGGEGRPLRGIGEPIWGERSPDELVECERHEALLNLAFADSPPWRLLCPYDLETLDAAVIEEARRNHPAFVHEGRSAASAAYRDLAAIAEPFGRPLPEPAVEPETIVFEREALAALRRVVAARAEAFGLVGARADDVVLAVNEAATNSLRHGGGRGTLRVWSENGTLLCEVRDEGVIADPLVGRATPVPTQESGFGLWLVNQLCDLVQIRTFPTGSVVRIHMRRESP